LFRFLKKFSKDDDCRGELNLNIKDNRAHITGNAVTMMAGEWLFPE